MAFGLAVYASPCGLPRPDARLASSRWSDATGRAFTRRVPTKGFRGVIVTSRPPSPSLFGAITSTTASAGTCGAATPAASSLIAYAVSVNLVRGSSLGVVPDGKGGRQGIPGYAYEYCRHFRPTAKAGYSIFLYHITPEEANRVRPQLGLAPLGEPE